MKTILIDADSIIYTVCYNKKLIGLDGDYMIDDLGNVVTENKSLQQCKELVDRMITSIILTTESTHYLLFLTIGKNFRYFIDPLYKAKRKQEKPKWFIEIKFYLQDKYKAIWHNDLESDDLCLIYKNNILNSMIASPDKDILNLEGEHYNYQKGKFINNSQKEAYKYFWMSLITGDTCDGICGLPKKGIKFAEKLFNRIEQDDEKFSTFVFDEYINHFGEEKGVEEFYKTYKLLKIKDKYEELDIKEPIEFKESLIRNEF